MDDRIDCGQVLRDACRSARELQRRNEPLLPASSQLLAEDSARSSMAKSRRQEAEQFHATVGGARMEPVRSNYLPGPAFRSKHSALSSCVEDILFLALLTSTKIAKSLSLRRVVACGRW